ncbi:MAG: DUF262 domain-containing protein [Phycisphaerae bacterium]|nr:DUF262 domain-containing protein [Phycisphaerae bacterium]
MFDPQTKYDIHFDSILIKDFHDYKEEYVVRPPYQRKSVWNKKKKQDLLDSMFRRFYIPRIVIRLVRVGNEKTLKEVIDGQQRINTAQEFFANELKLPKSLKNLHEELPGKTYSELSVEHRKFVDRNIKYNADIVKGIDNPRHPEHQRVASEIFWRLQQGESLNYMEKAHARLSSLSRNFIVKYADDITFDYEEYKPIDENPYKHRFFSIINRKNDRMQHLALMTRFLILEENGGVADLKDSNVMEYIDKYLDEKGIGNDSFENNTYAKSVISTISTLAEIFKNDPMLDDEEENENGEIRELNREYFIISVYLLLRHLKKYYVLSDKEKVFFREFVLDFHMRWREKHEDDRDIIVFQASRQQSINEIETRHRIIRQVFFEYAKENDIEILTKDDRRSFNESERILIYRRDNGLCQECLKEEKPEKECRVPWSDYDADHVVPHSKGGVTNVDNAQLLCRCHNQKKSNKV